MYISDFIKAPPLYADGYNGGAGGTSVVTPGLTGYTGGGSPSNYPGYVKIVSA